MYCLKCKKELTKSQLNEKGKFCSHSCNASYNNINRKGKRYNMSLEGIENIRKANKLKKGKRVIKNKQFLDDRIAFYNISPNKCIICDSNILYIKRNNKTCSNKCYKLLLSKNAYKNKLGGNNNRKAFWYNSNIAGDVFLESSYELIIAKILDDNNINWLRPKPFKWIDNNGKHHLYYPDFFLNDYNIYLDPKNDYLIQQDAEKIKNVITQNNISLFIINREQLNIKYIKELILVRDSNSYPLVTKQ